MFGVCVRKGPIDVFRRTPAILGRLSLAPQLHGALLSS